MNYIHDSFTGPVMHYIPPRVLYRPPPIRIPRVKFVFKRRVPAVHNANQQQQPNTTTTTNSA
jgi:hypothetical protein